MYFSMMFTSFQNSQERIAGLYDQRATIYRSRCLNSFLASGFVKNSSGCRHGPPLAALYGQRSHMACMGLIRSELNESMQYISFRPRCSAKSTT